MIFEHQPLPLCGIPCYDYFTMRNAHDISVLNDAQPLAVVRAFTRPLSPATDRLPASGSYGVKGTTEGHISMEGQKM